jgi:hypothetical protein
VDYNKQIIAKITDTDRNKIFSAPIDNILSLTSIEHLFYRTTRNSGLRMVSRPFTVGHITVPMRFYWDGSSTPWGLRWIVSKWQHPKASCTHDFLCALARNDRERKYADRVFKHLVSRTSWKITEQAAYGGVRIGAFFGIGSDFK